MPIFGPTTLALSGFPVAAAGWYFGLAGGIIASLIAIIFNYFLMTVFGGIPWYTIDRNSFFHERIYSYHYWRKLRANEKKYYKARIQTETQLVSRERFLSLLNNMTQTIIAGQSLDAMMQILANDLTSSARSG